MSAKVKSVIVAKAKELNGMVEKPDTATLSLSEIEAQMDVVCDIARRCKAAHEREVTVLRDALKDAIELFCATCTDYEENSGKCKDKDGVCPPVARWRKALEGKVDGK